MRVLTDVSAHTYINICVKKKKLVSAGGPDCKSRSAARFCCRSAAERGHGQGARPVRGCCAEQRPFFRPYERARRGSRKPACPGPFFFLASCWVSRDDLACFARGVCFSVCTIAFVQVNHHGHRPPSSPFSSFLFPLPPFLPASTRTTAPDARARRDQR
jgi:hypothetical protein